MSALSMPRPSSHIYVDSNGTAWIEGTKYRVTTIVLDHVAYGWSPEEIHYQHYGQLTLAQIYAALAYYYENQEQIDEQIARQLEEIERRAKESGESPFEQRMRAEGKLP